MAIAFDPTAFKLVYTEFAAESDDRLNAVSDQARFYVNEGVFGTRAGYALALYTAHLLTLMRRGASGPLTMEKVGDLTNQYAQPTITAKDLNVTAYGAQFSKLASSATGTGIRFVGA